MSDMCSDSDSDFSDSELGDYAEKAYIRMKDGKPPRILNPDGSLRCPFCPGKKKQVYQFKDLLQHALGRGSSSSRKPKERANHLALARFLESDLVPAAGIPLPSNLPSSSSSSISKELFVYPWVGVLINLPIEDDADSLQEQYSNFNPVSVIAGKGEAVIWFNKDWMGFNDAMKFDDHFTGRRLGKKDWSKRKGAGLSGVHGWVARDDDYGSGLGFAAGMLRKHGELKTVEELTEEETRERRMAVDELVKELEDRNKYLQELECRYSDTKLSLKIMMDSNTKIMQGYNEGELVILIG